MSSKISAPERAITLQNLSKMYRLFERHGERVREALHPFRKKFHREFWALDNVDLIVPRGQTLGIIGRNGSGKTTLLQLIAGVLRQTRGSVEVNGRISALLELGAGFNGELTGRNNVMINGTVQGFTPDEMEMRIPEIESFAEIGKFFDQPVKTYSSGMFVRLAFGTAINMDPDILIIDEALAVGDARFQLKCYDLLKNLQKRNKTILFVSHSQDAIANLCSRCLLLEGGQIIADGEPAKVLPRYHELLFTGEIKGTGPVKVEEFEDIIPEKDEIKSRFGTSFSVKNPEIASYIERVSTKDSCHHHLNYNPDEYRFGDRRAIIIDYGVFTQKGMNTIEVDYGENLDLIFSVLVRKPVNRPMVGYSIKRVDGVTLAGINTRLMDYPLKPFTTAGQVLSFHFLIQMCLAPADVFIELGVAEWLSDRDAPSDIRKNLIQMKVISGERLEGIAGLNRHFEDLRQPE